MKTIFPTLHHFTDFDIMYDDLHTLNGLWNGCEDLLQFPKYELGVIGDVLIFDTSKGIFIPTAYEPMIYCCHSN